MKTPSRFPALPIRLCLLTVAVIFFSSHALADSHSQAERLAALQKQAQTGADVSDQLQELVDAGAPALALPPGTYHISKSIEVDLDSIGPFSLSGNGAATIVKTTAGPALRLVGTHFKSADPGGFTENVWKNQRMPLVDGVGFTATSAEATGIEAVGTMQLTITRCHFRKLLHGIHLRENNRNVIVADCHVYENAGIGIFLDDVNLHQINVTGCHVSYCDGGGIVSRKGNVRNLHITGCDIESNMGAPHESAANVEIDCRGSAYGTAEVAITGCTIQHNSKTADSANIRIYGGSEGRDGERLREGNVTITGNILSDVQHNIHLSRCRGVTITGNTLWMGYEHQMKLEHCSAVAIGANNLDRNPRYAYGDSTTTKNATLLVDCDRCIISGLLVTNVQESRAGLHLKDCRSINIAGCSLFDCSGPELLLENCENCRVSDCITADERFDTEAGPNERIQVVGGSGNRVETGDEGN